MALLSVFIVTSDSNIIGDWDMQIEGVFSYHQLALDYITKQEELEVSENREYIIEEFEVKELL